jgi:drug/metabolite transporter (DMT)-like permease
MGIALGLGAALSWGLADYFAAVASRRIGALRVVLGFHLVALIPLTALALATDALAHVSVGEVAVLAGVGAVGWLSYLTFYGALAIGPISVLSPIVSGYAAITALLAVGFAGSRLSALQSVAVAITIGGTMLASADVREIMRAKLQPRSVLGFVLALCAMCLLGAFVFGVSYYRQRIGWLGPIFLARGFATVFLLGHVLVSGARVTPPGAAAGVHGGEPAAVQTASVQTASVQTASVQTVRRTPVVAIIALLALVDTGGYVFFNLGVGHAPTAIVAAASAPYALVPIAMGVSLFRERPTRAQWLGVACVLVGVIVLGAVA